ncbi:MAG: hypothetical protein KAT39_11195, partial [Alphaproteobacteria bacterium]|nr:hypothetical protein [Alphaproteobacteria bacterium]
RVTDVATDAGNFQTDSTMVRVGEVATGQDRSDIQSPDGNAVLVIPPLSLPAGMGTLSIDLADQVLPVGAPEAQSRVYSFAPAGLQLATPVEIAIVSDIGRSIVALNRSGAARPLPTHREGTVLRARVSDAPIGTRFYAADIPPPDVDTDKALIAVAPWLADAPDPGLIAAQIQPPADTALAKGPFPLNERLALVLSFTARDLRQVGLVLRHDNNAVLVPLAEVINGVDSKLALPGLGLSPAEAPQALFLPLHRLLPASARQLDSVELVQITAAAWRTFVSRPVTASQIVVHTATLGTVPAKQGSTRWTAQANWRAGAQGSLREGVIDLEDSGWHWISFEGKPDNQAWPVLVDNAAPEITALSPESGIETGELFVGAMLRDIGGGIDRNSIHLSINGVAVPDSAISFEPRDGRMRAAIGDLAEARITSGAEVTARLEVSDIFGQAAEPVEWSWRHLNKALSLGNLRQITVEGGSHPAWMPDGSGFVYVAEIDGQTDLFRMDLDGDQPVRLTNSAKREFSPAPGPNGSIAIVADGALRLLIESETTTLAADVIDPSWTDANSLVVGMENRVVRVGLDGTTETLCTAATGATVLRPGPAGDVIV